MTTKQAGQKITSRSVQGEDDFWRVRELLSDTYSLMPPDFNWEVRRWDGTAFFYSEEPGWNESWGEGVNRMRIWENAAGKIVGVANPDGRGAEAYLQVHPDYRFLEEEMIIWAEEHIAVPTKDGKNRTIFFSVWEYDAHRQRLLEQRGWEKIEDKWWEVIRHLRLGDAPLPQAVMAEGYTLGNVNPDDLGDCQKIADILNAAFGRDSHTGKEFQSFALRAPSYKKELDLVAVAPDGIFAAYVGIAYDDANQYAIFEPVCTHPDHRKKGLAQALMFEGLHRAKAFGAAEISVGTGDMVPANALYDSIGFTEAHRAYVWKKVI